MPDDRDSTIPPDRGMASEGSKSLELEQRVGRLEVNVAALRDLANLLTKQIAALQAQLDHLAAKLGRS